MGPLVRLGVKIRQSCPRARSWSEYTSGRWRLVRSPDHTPETRCITKMAHMTATRARVSGAARYVVFCWTGSSGIRPQLRQLDLDHVTDDELRLAPYGRERQVCRIWLLSWRSRLEGARIDETALVGIVLAAGVVLVDVHQRVLLTKRDDFDVWCLPGGMVEAGESG